MWTRAQINVAPVRPDDNSVLILVSGKCSNFTEFEPFAVRLNPDSLIYEVDADFDIDSWREQIVTNGKRKAALQPQMLRECLTKGREYDLKGLTAIVMEHFVVQKTCAYDLIRKAKKGGVLRYNKMIKTYTLV